LGISNNSFLIHSQGCSSFVSNYLDLSFIESPVGMSTSVASGIKNVLPDSLVFTYQGEGDVLSYGLSELIHLAHRSERITVIMINNLVMAQSGGQMSLTSLPGQITETTPFGKS